MTGPPAEERALVLAPKGRDAAVAVAILGEAGLAAAACPDLAALVRDTAAGAGLVVVTEEALAAADLSPLSAWLDAQPPWSDLPFVVLSRRGEPGRNPDRTRLVGRLGNASFIERPFHAMTLASVARAALKARRRQYQGRDLLLERERGEAALRDSEARLRLALDAGRLGSWELDLQTGEFTTSRTCRTNLGRDPERPLAYADLRDAVHPEDKDRMAAAVEASIAGRSDYDVEYRVLTPDGEVRWAQIRGRLAYAPNGRPVRMVGVSLDVTERKLAEAALRRANETLESRVAERTGELEAANRDLLAQIAQRERAEAALLQAQKMEAVGQLTGGVAHDFNNLLAVIVGNLDLLRARAAGDARLARLVDHALQAAERGATLTAQLLAFSRSQRLTPTPVDVNRLISGMSDLLARTIGRPVEIRLDLDPAVGGAMAEPNQLELAVLNLAINARDAMPEGGVVTIATAVVDVAPGGEEAPGRYAVVRVEDTGTGMPPEVLLRAFEPFFTTKGVGKGTGLGLAQVYGVAKQSGGTARIESACEGGTVVTVLLPAVPMPTAADGAAAAAGEAIDAVRLDVARRRTVPAVDDPDAQDVMADSLAGAALPRGLRA